MLTSKTLYYILAAILGFVNMIGIVMIMYVMINQRSLYLMIELITEFTYLELLTIAFVSSLVILWYGSKR